MQDESWTQLKVSASKDYFKNNKKQNKLLSVIREYFASFSNKSALMPYSIHFLYQFIQVPDLFTKIRPEKTTK